MAGKVKELLMPLYRRFNILAWRVKKTPQDIETLRRLKELYAELNARLASMIDLDTSGWSDEA